MRNIKTAFNHRKGYTLLEIAVSLTIIGILAAIAAASVIPMASIRKLSEFKLASDRAMEWVDRFALANRRLPDINEFKAQNPQKTGDLILEYHVNPNIASFNLPEMYLGYRINHNDPTNLVHAKPDNSTVMEDFAYYIDARFPDDSGISAYRQVKRYYPFLKLMGNGVQNNYVRVITATLPKGKRLQRYDADILISGGMTKPGATPSDCNLGRNLDVAVGIRAPAEWHHFFSSKYHGTWDTIENVKNIFNAKEIFLLGTDCTGGISNNKTTCGSDMKPLVKFPSAGFEWKHLDNCGGSANPTDYVYNISSMDTKNAVYNSANPKDFMQGKIPPYLRDFNFMYTYNNGDYPLGKFNYIYLGSHFYFEVFVRDNNNKDKDGNPIIVQKTLRVDLDPVKGIYPPK